MDPGDEINACASLAKRGLVGNPSDGWQPRVGAYDAIILLQTHGAA